MNDRFGRAFPPGSFGAGACQAACGDEVGEADVRVDRHGVTHGPLRPSGAVSNEVRFAPSMSNCGVVFCYSKAAVQQGSAGTVDIGWIAENLIVNHLSGSRHSAFGKFGIDTKRVL